MIKKFFLFLLIKTFALLPDRRLATLVRWLASWHYEVTVINPEAANDFSGLVCPDHVALVDPPIFVSHVGSRMAHFPRPVAHSAMYDTLKRIMRRARAIRIESTADGISDWKRFKIKSVLNGEVKTALKNSESLLIYPSGQLRAGEQESLGGKSSVFELLAENPNIPLLLARIRGLRGSVWSRFFTNGVQTPDWPHRKKLLWRNRWSWLFKRVHVTIELERFDNVPQFATARELNKWLENWYNQTPDPVIPGREHWDPVDEFTYSDRVTEHDDVSLDPKVFEKVVAYLASKSTVSAEAIRIDDNLIRDLGLDSLVTSTLPLWAEERFGVEVDPNAQMVTVRDVVLASMGSLKETGEARDITTPKGWIEKERKAPQFMPAENLVAAFMKQSNRMGSRAVCMGDDRYGVLTYGQVNQKVVLLARFLKKHIPEDTVGMMLPASVGATIVTMAVLLSGKKLAPLNWTNGRAALDHSIELAGVKTILTSDLFLDKANVEMSDETLKKVFVLESILGKLGKIGGLKAFVMSSVIAGFHPSITLRFLGYQAKLDDVAVILFTSGSESAPKGVPLTHRNLLSNIEGGIEAIGGYSNDVMYGFLPPFHSFGMTKILMLSLVSGVKVAFDPDPKKSRHLAHGVEKWQATLIPGTPDFLMGILNAGESKNFTTMRAMLSGAQKAPAELRRRVEELDAKLLEGYGITETAPLVAVTRPEEEPVGVGKPVKGVEIVITDPEDHTKVRPDGEEGLILVHGPNVFNGYLGDVKSPFTEVGGRRHYNTGDLGFMQEGNLVISGRMKRFLKYAGEMISLPAIEDALIARWPAGENGPVVTVEGEEREDDRPIICLYTTEPSITIESANQALKAAGIPSTAYVRYMHALDEIPLLGSGKTNYRALPRPSEIAAATA